MPGSGVPIVYAETNWIVSLLYKHRPQHLAATELRAAASRGEIDLRVPYACLIEAVGAIDAAGREAMESIAKATRYITTAQRHGESSLDAVAALLPQTTAFLKVESRSFLEALRNEQRISWLVAPVDDLNQLDAVRRQIRFKGKDWFDLCVIAAVIADRAKSPGGPAFFFSENKAEFEPAAAGPLHTATASAATEPQQRRRTMPDQLYQDAQLVWRDDYKVIDAGHQWNNRFAKVAAPSGT
jgi:hypothetical protein